MTMKWSLAEIGEIHSNALHNMLRHRTDGRSYQAAKDLYQLYAEITEITADTPNDDIRLPTGIAIAAGAAAHCLLEHVRTATFLKGIHDAIEHLLASYPNERLHVLYAGCGPYAALVTPLLQLYQPSQLSIDLLDINPAAIASVAKLFETLHLNAFLNSLTLWDATTYRISSEMPVRLLISETLNAGLKNEPFVSILQNLVPQLAPDAIVIPECVSVEAVFIDMQQEMRRFTSPDIHSARLPVKKIGEVGHLTPYPPLPATFSVPEVDLNSHKLYLVTQVAVYGNEKLLDYDCSLTLPMAVRVPKLAPGDLLTCRYTIGEKTGFLFEHRPLRLPDKH